MRTSTLALATTLLALACNGGDTSTKTDSVDDGSGEGSDNTGGETGGETGDDGSPAASIDVDLVDLGVVCDTAEASFTISNGGDAPLIIEDVDVEGAWTIASEVAEIAAGSSATFLFTGAGGDGLVKVSTNDPSNELFTVELRATANQPPSILMGAVSPVLAPGAMETIEATVTDDQGADALALSWESDVDGILSTDSADASGEAQLSWDGTAQTEGGHVLTLTATDTCGASTTETVSFCQNLGYEEASLDLSTWTFTGSANWDSTNGWVELTDTRRYITGTAFQTSQTLDSTNISIEFLFYASGGSSSGADGLSLTAIDTSRMTSYEGQVGGALGYGGLPGWSVEVDTWDNTGDPGLSEPSRADHVSFVLDGASDGIGIVSADIHEVEDNMWHRMEVDVSGTQVTVAIDGIVYIDDPVDELTSFPAHIGFTAATGNITNNHLIDALAVERFVCDD